MTTSRPSNRPERFTLSSGRRRSRPRTISTRSRRSPSSSKGWEPIATLTFDTTTPMIYEWPEKECPHEYREATTFCQHCNSNRRRNRVFVLRNVESGDHIQVGSTCVRDFIGYDPGKLAKMFEFTKMDRTSVEIRWRF